MPAFRGSPCRTGHELDLFIYYWYHIQHIHSILYSSTDFVIRLLGDAAMSQALSYVVLSGLLEQVFYRKDWERTEILWAIFMRKGIEPNLICVLARAKVHLLAGRPTAVLEMLQSGMAGCGVVL